MEKNIHFVILGSMPDWAQANIGRFAALNPGWAVLLHNQNFAMHESYRRAMKVATTVGGQCDILRLACLETFGGWYFDWDVYPLRPIDETDTAGMIGDKLLLWTCPQTSGMMMSSICAAGTSSKAWPVVHELMDMIASKEAPDPAEFNPVYYEMFICKMMRRLHGGLVTSGDPDEFTVSGVYLKDIEIYKKLLAGEQVDTGRCAFLHGWSGLSTRPAIGVSNG
jgi:hypothetical protein